MVAAVDVASTPSKLVKKSDFRYGLNLRNGRAVLRLRVCGVADVVSMRISPTPKFWSSTDWLNGLNLTTGAFVAEDKVLVTVGLVLNRRVGLDGAVGMVVGWLASTGPSVEGGGWVVVVVSK